MKSQTARSKKQTGFSLIELLVALLVGSMAIALVLVLLKNAYRVAGEVKLTRDNKVLVSEFVKVFHEEVAASGYKIDQDLQTPDSNPKDLIFWNQIVDELPFTSASRVINQRVAYEVRRIQPARGTFHADEFGLFKTKMLGGVEQVGSSDINQLVLAGLPSQKAFECVESIDKFTWVCTLQVYRSMNAAGVDVYKIIARIENVDY
jgi:hypothetical protein